MINKFLYQLVITYTSCNILELKPFWPFTNLTKFNELSLTSFFTILEEGVEFHTRHIMSENMTASNN